MLHGVITYESNCMVKDHGYNSVVCHKKGLQNLVPVQFTRKCHNCNELQLTSGFMLDKSELQY